MKKIFKAILIFAVLVVMISMQSCSTVPAGNVGIKFHLLGSDKGVDYDVLSPGRYWIGINEKLYLFPTQHQTMIWTDDEREGSPNDEHFDFQSKKGLQLKGNFALEYHMRPDDVPYIFETYKKGADEVSRIILRNVMRDAINKSASYFTAAEIFGEKKMEFMDSVTVNVKRLAASKRFVIDNVYLLGNIVPPRSVVDALNAKVKAREIAQQKQNELVQVQADAAKAVAKARGDSLSAVVRAAGKAKANKLLNASLTPNLIKYYQVERWDGVLPKVNGSGMIPIVDMK
jgi:regulator of protease activity HflC (stomatin/prohibitin superfamily)